MRIKSILFLLLTGIVIPVSYLSGESLTFHLNEMREAINVEIRQYSSKIREISGDVTVNILAENQDLKKYGKLTELLSDLPEPEDGIDPQLHYRSIINGIIEHQIINPIITLTHSSLIPLNTLGSDRIDSTAYNLILTDTLTFVERLSEIKMLFLEKVAPLDEN